MFSLALPYHIQLIHDQMLLYGAGGHAKVIAECLRSRGQSVQGIFDDNTTKTDILGIKVLGVYAPDIFPESACIIAIGNNQIRAKLSQSIKHHWATAIHLRAYVSEYANLGEGTVVMQNVVIQADVQIGKHCIINTSAVVEHDCLLGDFVHIAPNATLCGHVCVGEGTLIGAGAVVTPSVKIGKWASIGAGVAVTKDVADFEVLRS